MTINIIQTITNVFDENHELLRTSQTEVYVIYPTEGKALKDTKENKIYKGSVSVSRSQAKHFIEVDL